jgi:hypothetical protein
VRAGVSADVALRPILWRALLVVDAEGGRIILLLVTEEAAKIVEPRRAGDQRVPGIMTYLMA